MAVLPDRPGAFVEERSPARVEEGLSPSFMGIAGFTTKGPTDDPKRVKGYEQFRKLFGDLTSMSLVPITMEAFFGNEGKEAYIVRVVPADAVKATGQIDTPAKWNLSLAWAGLAGNDVVLRIRGNESFLNIAGKKWDKFDVLVLEPDDFGTLVASESYEALQFTDSAAFDYFSRALNDDQSGSEIVDVVEALGGTPAGLVAVAIADEDIGTGDDIETNFAGTLAAPPVLQTTLRIVASEATVNDEAQTPTPAIDGIETDFTFTLVGGAILDGSLRLFYQRLSISNEQPTVTGLINGINQDYTIAVGGIANPVHREIVVFRLKYAKTAASSPENLTTIGGVAAPYDLSTIPLTDTPVHPGTVVISVDEDGVGATTITDDGNGNLIGTSVTVLPGGGTINYDTGAMTGITANLTALSSVDAAYNQSAVITKAASADNKATGVALGGAVDVLGTNTINLVDSQTNPTQNGLLDFKTLTAPISGTLFYLDYVALGIVNDDLAGDLTGNVGVGTNTVDPTDGSVDVAFSNPPLAGSTIDADYEQGQVVTDNGVGALIGDVDPDGVNTINYETGEFDVTFATAPPSGTDVLANYTQLPKEVDYAFAGGSNGTAVTRDVISNASLLESSKRGIFAFDKVEDILNITLPDFAGNATVARDQIDFADARKTRFIILSGPEGFTDSEMIQYVRNDVARDTKNAAYYYPNIKFFNRLTQATEIIPNLGNVAGVYARTDRQKNVGKAPAGSSDGLILGDGVIGLEFKIEPEVEARLFANRVNVIIDRPSTGTIVNGARTASREKAWRYIQARRLFMFIGELARRRTQFAVFENNGPALWQRVTLVLNGDLTTLYKAGYFAGATAAQAYFVRVDDTNNDQSTIELGLVNIDIGFAPFNPAEFLVNRVQQIQRQQV